MVTIGGELISTHCNWKNDEDIFFFSPNSIMDITNNSISVENYVNPWQKHWTKILQNSRPICFNTRCVWTPVLIVYVHAKINTTFTCHMVFSPPIYTTHLWKLPGEIQWITLPVRRHIVYTHLQINLKIQTRVLKATRFMHLVSKYIVFSIHAYIETV